MRNINKNYDLTNLKITLINYLVKGIFRNNLSRRKLPIYGSKEINLINKPARGPAYFFTRLAYYARQDL
ncbi:hypothetical protein D8M09_07790 [Enterobacter sp. R1(2018)]|nr:hypothetical protein D8M09_07790 [Enterobacter sp. R1(2018)]